ncbi:hypothetical protein Tco_0152121 [Tanacetum coccineum]
MIKIPNNPQSYGTRLFELKGEWGRRGVKEKQHTSANLANDVGNGNNGGNKENKVDDGRLDRLNKVNDEGATVYGSTFTSHGSSNITGDTFHATEVTSQGSKTTSTNSSDVTEAFKSSTTQDDNGVVPNNSKTTSPNLNVNVPNGVDYDVWFPLASVYEVNNRMKNSLYSDRLVMDVPNLEENGYTKETIRIEYEWEHPRCRKCLIFGHSPIDCPKAMMRCHLYTFREEIHVTWTQFRKQRDKNTTLQNFDQAMVYRSWRWRQDFHMTSSWFQGNDVTSICNGVKQLLNDFMNSPDVLEMDDLESYNESIDTPLVSPFLDIDEELDDKEVLNELNEYGNAGNFYHNRITNSIDGNDLAFPCMIDL